MSGPDRIWLQDAGDYEGAAEFEVTWCIEPQDDGDTEYVRRDPAVLATLPEVQAMIAEAVAKERADCLQAAHDAVTHPIAYACVAAIRKRTEGKA